MIKCGFSNFSFTDDAATGASGEETVRIQISEEHKSTPERSEMRREMPEQEMEYNNGQIRARKQSGEADG